MKNRTRFLSVLLAASLVAVMLAGCSKTPEVKYLKVDGEEIAVPYVLKIDGSEVPMEEYRYYFMSIKSQYDNGDSSYWLSNAEGEDELKETVLDQLTYLYAAMELAKENNMTLTAEELSSIDDSLEETKASFDTDAEYIAALNQNYIPSETFYKNTVIAKYQLYQKLFTDLYSETGANALSDEELISFVEDHYVRASHILVAFGDDEEASATKARAEEALSRVQSGEDFDALVAEYGEDPGMTDNTDGYYFTTGEMVEPFEQAAFALKEGETSGLVETTYGYHIIKRLPMEVSYISENRETFLQGYVEKIIADKQEAAAVEYCEQYDVINTSNLS